MQQATVSAFIDGLAANAAKQIALQAARPRGRAEDVCGFQELADRSASLAASFQALGLKPGDSLAIWLPNNPLWLIAHFAAARAGLTTIPLNTWYRETEIDHFLALSSARAVLIDSEFKEVRSREILQSVLSRRSLSIRWVIDVASEVSQSRPSHFIPLDELPKGAPSQSLSDQENPALIAFSTSGTTALPKLAVHRESSPLTHAAAVVERAGITRSDVILAALPLCGAYGYTLILSSLMAQARAVQLERFDLDHMIEVIERERVTVMALTEPLMRSLLEHPRATASTLASLRLVFSAGSTLQPIVDRAEREFGFYVTNVYGSSEVLALAAFWNSGEPVEIRAGAGGELVHPQMEISVVDDAGRTLRNGEHGELRFRGTALTSGYLQSEGGVLTAVDHDGWFKSGDLGFLVDGSSRCFRYLSRMGDAIRLKGFLVNPAEIETCLQKHSAVAAAQVVGVPGQDGEDRAIAFVTLNGGAAVSAADLQNFCREKMASYKVPSNVRIIESFPTTRSANGDKIQKNRLREMAEVLTTDD